MPEVDVSVWKLLAANAPTGVALIIFAWMFIHLLNKLADKVFAHSTEATKQTVTAQQRVADAIDSNTAVLHEIKGQLSTGANTNNNVRTLRPHSVASAEVEQ